MDSMFEDDISILTQEALGPDEDWLDSPNTDLSGEMCSASHFALITAYDDIKNRLTALERENSTLKRRLKMYEVKYPLIGEFGEEHIFSLYEAKENSLLKSEKASLQQQLNQFQHELQKSKEREEQLEEMIQAYEKLCVEKADLETELGEMRALVETHLSRIRSLEQQLRQRDSGAFPGLGTQDVPFIALHPNPGLSHVLERAAGWQSRGLEAELEAARQENQRAQHREEQLKAECERLQEELKHLRDTREQEQSERDMAWVKKVGDDQVNLALAYTELTEELCRLRNLSSLQSQILRALLQEKSLNGGQRHSPLSQCHSPAQQRRSPAPQCPSPVPPGRPQCQSPALQRRSPGPPSQSPAQQRRSPAPGPCQSPAQQRRSPVPPPSQSPAQQRRSPAPPPPPCPSPTSASPHRLPGERMELGYAKPSSRHIKAGFQGRRSYSEVTNVALYQQSRSLWLQPEASTLPKHRPYGEVYLGGAGAPLSAHEPFEEHVRFEKQSSDEEEWALPSPPSPEHGAIRCASFCAGFPAPDADAAHRTAAAYARAEHAQSWPSINSRKDKERPKQKHKKRPESPSSLPPAPTAPVAEKGSGGHHEATKDSSEVARAEAKGRKSSSHGSSHKGKKTGSGKSSGGFGTAAPGGTFQAAGSSCALPASQDFAPFPKLEQEEEKFRKAASSSSSSHCSPLYEGPKADVFEQKVIFSGFGSIMRFSTSSVGQQRARDASPVDYKAPGGPSGGTAGTGGATTTGHKRLPSLSAEEGELLKEKKHKGSKKNKHGPGRPKAGKGKELLGAQLAGSTSTSSSPFSGGSLVSSSVGSSSRSFGHASSLPSLSVESPLLGSGIYTSNKDPIPLGAALRAVCSTPLPSGLLPHQGGAALPQLSRSPFASSIPACSSSAGSTTQVFSLAGSTFSLPSSHIFGSPLTSGLSLNPLLSQPESSRAEPDLEDCGFGCRGTSPQESLSSMSPISSLPTLFDQTVSCSSSGQLDNVPQATPNIEQLLEKQGNGEAGVNIVEMLKALHSLQKENQRLQEQIMTLTAKKERLQLLNVQLSVPFPVVTSSNGPGSQGQYILPASACTGDSLSISKSPPCKNSFGIENSLSTSSEDPHSGCPSRSSSSLSFHSTPPPLPMLQPSPASLPLPGAQQVNGLARVAGGGLAGGSGAGHSLSAVPVVDSLLGSLGAQQMPLNGILGSLNGAQPAQPPPQASGPPALPLSTGLSSVASLSPLTEQQRHVLQQHEQQLQQLQQLLTSQPLNPEQQALVFQMMQQIQQKRELQRLQMSGSSQLAMSGLLAATSAPLHSSPGALLTSAAPSGGSLLASLSPQQLNPGGALLAPQATPPLGSGSAMAQPNPFLSLQPDGGAPKGAPLGDKGAPLAQDKG